MKGYNGHRRTMRERITMGKCIRYYGTIPVWFIRMLLGLPND